ncbi:MAG: hypothetical protein FJ102_21805 [Deltaproteobacteria bacterium]|nr:hypothetical protein [Deltaproteobacteria bacterium]
MSGSTPAAAPPAGPGDEPARAESLSAHERALAQLVPIAAHALSQPANVLQGYCEILELSHAPEHRERAVAAIQRASEQLTDILGDLRRATQSMEGVERFRERHDGKRARRVPSNEG